MVVLRTSMPLLRGRAYGRGTLLLRFINSIAEYPRLLGGGMNAQKLT